MSDGINPYSYVSPRRPIPPLPEIGNDPVLSQKMAKTRAKLQQYRKSKLTQDMLIKTLHGQATNNLQKITIQNRIQSTPAPKGKEPKTKPPPFPDQMMSDDRRMRLNYEFMKKCVQSAPIPTMSEDTWDSILTMLPPDLREEPSYFPLIDSLHFEIEKEYELSLRRYNVANTLLKPDSDGKIPETKMKFDEEGLDFSTTWRNSYEVARANIAQRLNILHPSMQTILDLSQKYVTTLLIDCSHLRAQGPIDAENMKNNVILDCEKNEEKLMNSWFHEVVNIFYDKKSFAHLKDDQQDSFYNCVSQLMGNILVSILVHTIKSWVALFDPADQYNLPLYKVQLVLEDNNMTFSPPLAELDEVIKSVITTVSKSLQNVPGVQSWLSGAATFVPIKSHVEQTTINEQSGLLKERVGGYFDGPKSHLEGLLTKYGYLIDGTAQKEVDTFLAGEFDLPDILAKIVEYKQVTTGIALEDSFGHYELVDLNIDQLKNSLMAISNTFVNQLLNTLVSQHINENNVIIAEFESIKKRALKTPQDTPEMIDLINFTTKSTTETIPRLQKQISEAAKRLDFLLDHYIFSDAEVELNKTTLNWPSKIAPIFEENDNIVADAKKLGETTLGDRREKVIAFYDFHFQK